jgi:hypothetical protein
VVRGELLRFVAEGEPFPVLQHLVEAEAGGAQSSGGAFRQGGREGQYDRFLALVLQPRLAGEGAPAEGGPFVDLVLVAGAVAQRQQRAIESVRLELEEAGLFDQPAGLDQAACAGLTLVVFELGFLLGEPGLLLLVRAQARSASERAIAIPRCVWIKPNQR